MKIKTISGHYDTIFSIEHNNRTFVPSNVVPARIPWNYNCVAAGEEAFLDLENPRCLLAFWQDYTRLSEAYWTKRSITQALEYEQYKAQMRRLRRLTYQLYNLPDDGITCFILLFFLPIIVPCGIYLNYQQLKVKEAWENGKFEQWLRDMEFKADKLSFREALHENDLKHGTQYLQMMDNTVREMAVYAGDFVTAAKTLSFTPAPVPRFATLEEIYDKCFEPAFQEFQSKQRPCRRYYGTYLEQIREGQNKAVKGKQHSRNSKCRKTAEAIEIVFGIGDMDNTGYERAFVDAKQSEELLKDFCDHLMENPHTCWVTTKELEDPAWQPPFKNGLIILNLTVHADEATPGVHLTCIPYSRGCNRGPAVQAALGRAMTGMGYPSTWKDILDENGARIPKRKRDGQVIYNQDGTIRYKQEPAGQGIIDWIEAQKLWLQREMEKRYGWKREYKGAHSRGNLSTPDYKVVRSQERCNEILQAANQELQGYQEHISKLTDELYDSVTQLFDNATDYDLIFKYLKLCPDEQYHNILQDAVNYFAKLPLEEEKKVMESLKDRINDANRRFTKQQNQKCENKRESLGQHK